LIKPFILGIEDFLPNAPYRSTEELYERVGHNTGNLVFHRAISLILGGLPSVSWYADPETVNGSGTIGVIPCANQLGPHTDYGSTAENFAGFRTQLVAVGLGAHADYEYSQIPEVPAGTLRWLREIVDRAPGSGPNITVRGKFSLRVLERYGLADHAVALGCPSLFLNPDPDLGKQIERRMDGCLGRIAVGAGHPGWVHLARLEASLVDLLASRQGGYIVQSPIEMVELGRGNAALLSPDALAECRDYIRPDLDGVAFTGWARQNARAFFDIEAWRAHLAGFTLLVGTRIHAAVLALNSGIPALCVVHDSRTRELCETMGVPFVAWRDVADGISHERLKDLVQFDGAAFDLNRQRLAKEFGHFLRSNGLAVARKYRALLLPEA
jgi:hypothetical protein